MIYASLAEPLRGEFKIVGVADLDPLRCKKVREKYGFPESMCFSSNEELMKHGKLADVIINGTMDAAVEVLRIAKQPMNTREIIEWAMKLELGQPAGAKTPEQTLYGAIVRENKTKEHPGIVKSDIKGRFIYAGE